MSAADENILSLLDLMEPIVLSEMSSIRLMNRIDTKYIATVDDLADVLDMAQTGYRVQETDGKRTGRYDTIYYDTDAADMYVLHHNRKLRRQKIRTRMYAGSGDAFLEIKNKNNRGRTKKIRIPIGADDFCGFTANGQACDFIYSESNYPLVRLSPHLRTSFDRITLVNRRKTERLTIDMNLRFENLRTGKARELPGMVVIELKQDGFAHSEMKEILMELRVRPRKISKYCIGTVLTNPYVPANRFKEKIRYIEKLIEP